MQSPYTVARSVLGSSAVTVPRIGIGAGTLSSSDGPAALIGALEAGLRRGLNYVDTAPLYLDGGSERAVGEFVSGHRREDIVLSTKVGRLADAPGREATGSRRRFDYSRRATVESVAASMARLRVDHLDAVIIHDVDSEMHPHFESSYRSAVGRCYPALAQLKRSAHRRSVSQRGTGRRAASAQRCRPRPADDGAPAPPQPRPSRWPVSRVAATRGPCRDRIAVQQRHPRNRRSRQPLRLRPGGPRCGAPAGRARRGIASPRREPRAAALQFPLAHPAVASVVVGNRSPPNWTAMPVRFASRSRRISGRSSRPSA